MELTNLWYLGWDLCFKPQPNWWIILTSFFSIQEPDDATPEKKKISLASATPQVGRIAG
ncbi:hypothetical protein [Oryza sativa Japonica Group]|uniref:Uncharacterized protein P0415C01.7 n=1 Tax=Oryza sativa subsp. japonica TaxID=39947 RepID=Q5ZC76_ORYSJ|nr:hypothetical protein [Oryza sativa Japonica Group]